MRLIFFLLVVCPLSIKAQNCPTSVQEVLTIEESTAVIDNAICVINDAEKVEMPCAPSKVVFYPNHTVDAVKARNTEGSDIEGNWRVWDLAGRKVLEGNKIKEIDLTDLPQGAYIVRLDYGDNWHIGKVVKL